MVLKLLSSLKVRPERQVVLPGTLTHVHALQGGEVVGSRRDGKEVEGVRKEARMEGGRKEVEGGRLVEM